MVSLVTLSQAKRHLRIFHDSEDVEVAEKRDQACAAVVDYIQRPEVTDTWTAAVDGSPSASPPIADVPSNAPFNVQASVLMVLDGLWENRGAEGEAGQSDGYLSKPVTALLHRVAKMSYA